MKLNLFSWFRKKLVTGFVKATIKDFKDGKLKQQAGKLLKENKDDIIGKIDEKIKKAVGRLQKQITELIEKTIKELED